MIQTPTTKRAVAGCLFLLLLANAQACSQKPQEETRDVAATAGRLLDAPFHFLLAIPDYDPNRFTHDADLFSGWGYLTLMRKAGNNTTRVAARDELLRAAKQGGWNQVTELSDVETPNLKRFGIHDEKEDLDISKTAALRGQNPPTRYGCRIWISENGGLIVVSYRVDGA